MIYDYLFFKGHQLGVISGNFVDDDLYAGFYCVTPCFVFNFGSVIFLLEGFGVSILDVFDKKYKLLFSLLVILAVYIYFVYKKRYKKIVLHYEEKERRERKGFHPLLVITFYYILSFCLMLLSGLFRNGDWLFEK